MTNEPTEESAYPHKTASFSFVRWGRTWWLGVVKISAKGAVYTAPCRNEEQADAAADALVIELKGRKA